MHVAVLRTTAAKQRAGSRCVRDYQVRRIRIVGVGMVGPQEPLVNELVELSAGAPAVRLLSGP